MVNIRPDEISNIIRQQIDSYDQQVQIANIGTVLQVGDGAVIDFVINRSKFLRFHSV